MIKMFTAHTREIDEVSDAVSDILKQINVKSLKKNSVGFIYCHSEFVDSGVVRAISESLPFDVVGMTTSSSASKEFYGVYDLSLAVWTSDTIEFKPTLTQPLATDDYEEKIADAYKELRDKQKVDPAFIVTYLPYSTTLSGAYLVSALDKACNGTPLFGSVCYGIDLGGQNSGTILNGKKYENSIVMLLVNGDIKPDFNAAALPQRYIRDDRAIITDSDRCILRKVNDTPILEYFASLGYSVENGAAIGAPLMVYYPGSTTPVALAMYAQLPDGSIFCGGEMPIGASLAIGEMNREIILETAKNSLDTILNKKDTNGVMIFPCSVRYFVLTPDQDAENKLSSELLNGKIPYILAYSGGEVCPVFDENGKLKNRFHNFTFCSCTF